jgi:hypothetical protein
MTSIHMCAAVEDAYVKRASIDVGFATRAHTLSTEQVAEHKQQRASMEKAARTRTCELHLCTVV